MMIWLCLGVWAFGSICFVAGAWWAARGEHAAASEQQALRSLPSPQETLPNDVLGSHRSSISLPKTSQRETKPRRSATTV